MLDLLRDSIWQFIGFVVPFVVSIILYRLQRVHKGLAYEIISETAQVSLDEAVDGDLQIFFNNKRVHSIYVVSMKIFNSGNTPIQAEEFYKPLKISFSQEAEILSAKVWGIPDEMRPQIELLTPQDMSLEPLLMNKGDTIFCEFLLSKFDGFLDVEGRVVGIKRIQAKTSNNRVVWIKVFLGIYSIITTYQLYRVLPTLFNNSSINYSGYILAFTIIVYFITMATIVVRTFYNKTLSSFIILWFVVYMLSYIMLLMTTVLSAN